MARRARTLPGTLGLTLLGALVPGAALIWAGRRLTGWLVLGVTVVLATAAAWFLVRDLRTVVELVTEPARLRAFAAGAAVALVAWACVVVASYRAVRPERPGAWRSVAGAAFVAALCLLVAAPVALGARYSMVQADLVHHVFEDNTSATAPYIPPSRVDPWHGRDRITVLLLGGDGGIDREGVRTDSMILASISTRTGATTTFSLPRNLMYARFPESSPLHALYPDGFTGPGDDGDWMLNAVYRQVPLLHPGVLGPSDNEGADAIKLAIQGSLGVAVDYYVLVNLAGFEKIVDAIGGVTVNLNQPIPVGGNHDLGRPPDYYLPAGPDQRLDGFKALWFSRGRWGTTDYVRMQRQRCMLSAIVAEARPATLIRRYTALATASRQIVRTDLPQTLLPALVDLARKMKDHDVRSVVFTPSQRFHSYDPDFDWIHGVVRRALAPPPSRPGQQSPSAPAPPAAGAGTTQAGVTEAGATDEGTPTSATDTCGYDPQNGTDVRIGIETGATD